LEAKKRVFGQGTEGGTDGLTHTKMTARINSALCDQADGRGQPGALWIAEAGEHGFGRKGSFADEVHVGGRLVISGKRDWG